MVCRARGEVYERMNAYPREEGQKTYWYHMYFSMKRVITPEIQRFTQHDPSLLMQTQYLHEQTPLARQQLSSVQCSSSEHADFELLEIRGPARRDGKRADISGDAQLTTFDNIDHIRTQRGGLGKKPQLTPRHP